ncbi:MAG: chemotaxis-specific protein-glutamate methyltransferase CheB [Acidobacteria bacterium]|nr:chemotaxis-specific protein-glutamate methyltransferase CheB [Acidobacteriota bacterium]
MGIRVLVVDDTAVFRRIVADALAGIPGVDVIGTAANGRLALARMAALKPDLVTLDIEMPEMNGIEVLEAMKPSGLTCGVIVLSAVTVRGGQLTVRALESGAFDFITKPDGGTPEENLALLRQTLAPMVRAFERRHEIRSILTRGQRPQSTAPAAPVAQIAPASGSPRAARSLTKTAPPLVLIGVSTGGPAALARVLPALPRDLGAPVFVVQHMPPMFTEPLAASLAAKCALRVVEAPAGEAAAANCVYIAPGGKHMKLVAGPKGEILIQITSDPPENNCRPAVDYLFRSAALNFPGRSVAAILTGMGNDGTAGLKMLKRSGCVALAQDEASCVVFGMPKEAIAAGVVDTVLPLDRMGEAIVRAVREAYP